MDFMSQFQNKAPCKELPANHRIPRDLCTPAAAGDEAPAAGGPAGGPARGAPWVGSSARSWRQTDDHQKLEVSERAWSSAQRAMKMDANEGVTRAMKSILNKLTVEKFDALYQKLLVCGIETRTHIETLMREVFEKATTQHHFIEMY